MTDTLDYRDLIQLAETSERNDDIKSAVTHYLRAIKLLPISVRPYERLMILFRKSKSYSKELAIINKAIHRFEKRYSLRNPSRHLTPKWSAISRRLGTQLGLLDKNGHSVYVPEPISRWKRRRLSVMKQINK